jgi:hypothetical protein
MLLRKQTLAENPARLFDKKFGAVKGIRGGLA